MGGEYTKTKVVFMCWILILNVSFNSFAYNLRLTFITGPVSTSD